MGEHSAIEWTDHSWNPWLGCRKVSPGCDHCYAERMVARMGVKFGGGELRRLTSESTWKLPLRWNRKAEREGVRRRVFPSLCDPFDAEVPDEWRDRLFALIALTPSLDWLLLTKRPQVAAKYIDGRWRPYGTPMILDNVWLGTSVENQAMADLRIPTVLRIPAAKRFLSVEPLLGPVDLTRIAIKCPNPPEVCCGGQAYDDVLNCTTVCPACEGPEPWGGASIDWVIVGGESGPKARPMHPDWARSIRDQCVEAGVPYFFKQWGEWAAHTPQPGGDLAGDLRVGRVRIVHPGAESLLEVSEMTGGRSTLPGSRYMVRVGKKAAGRQLDGREWNEVPT